MNEITHVHQLVEETKKRLFVFSLLTLFYFTQRRIRYTTAVIVTDSYSLLMALQTGPTTVEEGILRRIRTPILRLINRRVRLSFQFVFGHCKLTRNEDVDKLAKACMASDATSRAWITDLVTTTKRLNNTTRAGIQNAATLRRSLLGCNVPTKKNGDVPRGIARNRTPRQPSTYWCTPRCVPPESSSALTNFEGKISFAAINSPDG
ncbi:hypothetical protein N2W54_004153 [Lotmaria passim]